MSLPILKMMEQFKMLKKVNVLRTEHEFSTK